MSLPKNRCRGVEPVCTRLFTSIIFGTLAAIRAGRYTDRVLTVLSMVGVSMPPFFLGAVLISAGHPVGWALLPTALAVLALSLWLFRTAAKGWPVA